jgi:hypothetical protein
MACLSAMQGSLEKLKHYQREAARLQDQVQRWDQERVISKETLDRISELESEQNRANAKRPRKPKIPVTDEEKAVAKAREVFPAKLAEVPEDYARISKALTKVMNIEFAPGKKIGDYQDKEQLRQKLTRKKIV